MTEKVPFEIMNDVANWRHPQLCWSVLFAGVNYLYEELERRRPNSRLADRIRMVGGINLRRIESADDGSPEWRPEDPEQVRLVRDVDALGTIGFSLWHLRPYTNSVGFRYEFKQLSNVGYRKDDDADDPNLRGQGFMFLVAGYLAREGFEIEFVADPSTSGGRPDFLAKRDGLAYPCEATSRYPQIVKQRTVAEFWSKLVEVVEAKRRQLRSTEFENGVLLVDCSPIFDLVSISDLPTYGRSPAGAREAGTSRR